MKGVFLDIETTGLNPVKHNPIDIAFKVIDLSSRKLMGSYQSIIKLTKEDWEKKDITSLAVNGFTWEEVSKGKDVHIVSEEIISLLTALGVQRGSAVFICQNPSFDRGFFNQLIDVYRQECLNWPYHWLDLASMFWAMHVYEAQLEGKLPPEKISLSKNDIAHEYNLQPEESPHRAMKGVEHLVLCYQAVLNTHF